MVKRRFPIANGYGLWDYIALASSDETDFTEEWKEQDTPNLAIFSIIVEDGELR